MAKPYDHYEPGEIVEVSFYSTQQDVREIVKLSQTPEYDESCKSWIVIGYRRKNSRSFYDKPTKWWVNSISPKPYG